MHDKIGAEMLYSAILGPEPPSHPEWIAFREGFSLPCGNEFDFCKVNYLHFLILADNNTIRFPNFFKEAPNHFLIYFGQQRLLGLTASRPS